jgi:hypothetical protein
MCALVAVVLAVSYPDLLHWFLMPILACAAIVGADAGDWLTGKVDLIDPVGLFGLLGVHFFFLAPILQIVAQVPLRYAPYQPQDFRPWLGIMGILNFMGLVCYRIAIYKWSRARPARTKTIWHAGKGGLVPVLIFGCIASIGVEVYVLQYFGGLGGYVQSFELGNESFVGMGWIFMLSETFPILLMFLLAIRVWRRATSWFVLVPVLCLYSALELLGGGLRGSRQSVIWAVLWGVGIIHLAIRPVSRRVLLALGAVLLCFMSLYTFYKTDGLNGMRNLLASKSPAEALMGQRMATVLVQDLARSDIQALILYRLWHEQGNYEYALGRSYLGAVNLLVPKQFMAERFPTKLRWTTDLEYGQGSWDSHHWLSSRVYGLAGEALINFGPLGVLLTFTLLGIVIGKLRVFATALDRQDTRLLMVPLLVCLTLVVLAQDSDVDLFIAVKSGLIPFLLLYAGSKKYRLRSRGSWRVTHYQRVQHSRSDAVELQ